MKTYNTQIVVNYGIEYNAVYHLLRWSGVEPGGVLFTSFNKVVDDLDSFLFDQLSKDHPVLFIGFFPDKQEEIREVYKDYTNMRFLYSEKEGGLLTKMFQKCEIKTIDEARGRRFVRLVLGWSLEKFPVDSYVLNILYRKLHTDKYNQMVKGGMGSREFDKHRSVIYNHLSEFKDQPHRLFKLDIGEKPLYIVNSSIYFLDDYLHRFINKTGNLCLVDVGKKRVYFRKKPDNGVDILKVCEGLTSDGGGHAYACSGNITEKFMEAAKKAKVVEL